MTTEELTNPRMFPALRLLEKRCPPLAGGHEPFWRPPITPPSKNPLIPSWNWRGVRAVDIPDTESPITLDINGAFLAALGGVQVSHSQLKHMGPLDAWKFRPRFETTVWPGYYRIRVMNWAFSGTIVSPLGDSERLKTDAEVWVAHPTLVLLLELLEEGTLGELVITDAWVSNRRVDFRDWSAQLKAVRNGLLDQRDKADTPEEHEQAKDRYKAFKDGYSSAFSMMLTGDKCQTRRPDWAHAVRAQHAASSWRKAWRLSAIGPILHMGEVDTITILRSDLAKAVQKPKPPVRLDPSGRTLGHLKEKTQQPAPEPADHPDLIMSDDYRDVL